MSFSSSPVGLARVGLVVGLAGLRGGGREGMAGGVGERVGWIVGGLVFTEGVLPVMSSTGFWG